MGLLSRADRHASRRSNRREELLDYLRDPSSRPDIEHSAGAAQFRRTPQQPRVEPIIPSARGPATYSEPLERSDPPPYPFAIPAPPGYEEGADGALRRPMGRELYWNAPSDPFGRGGALMGDQKFDQESWRSPEQHFIGQRVTPFAVGAAAPDRGFAPPSADDNGFDANAEWAAARQRVESGMPSLGALSLAGQLRPDDPPAFWTGVDERAFRTAEEERVRAERARWQQGQRGSMHWRY